MKKKQAERILTLLFITACLFFYYSNFILSPDTYLATQSNDGIKSYAVYAGHIKNDSDYTNYRNMNFPFGQTHIYTDGQTGVANVVKWFSGFSSYFETHCIGIFNLMMIFSYVGCAFFLCLILQKLRLTSLFVIFGSVGITLMSPQVFRMGGHLTLSYAVFFPMAWWLFMRFLESDRKMFYSLLILLNSTAWFFVHPYYIMMTTVFYSGSYFFLWIQNKRPVRKEISFYLYAFLQIAIPLLLTRFYVSSVDTHDFRSAYPYGFWNYYAKLNTVFAPSAGMLAEWFRKIFSLHDQNWEGWAYIGLPAVLLTGYSLFRLFRYAVRKKIERIVTPPAPFILQHAVWAAVIALVFSMCMPFRLHLEWLVDRMEFIRQFRSLGRFAWIFYYVFTVYAVYLVYLLSRKMTMRKMKMAGILCSTFLFFFFFAESYGYHRDNALNMLRTANYFNPSLLTNDMKEVVDRIRIIKKNYSCIIPLPYFNVGNENYSVEHGEKTMVHAFVISHHTDVPLFANSAARSPILEGKKSMQFFSPPVIRKEIESDWPDQRPMLVLYDREKLDDVEAYWLKQSKVLLENNSYVLAELRYDQVFANLLKEETEKSKYLELKQSTYDGIMLSSVQDTVVYYSFDDQQSKHAWRGGRSFTGVKSNYSSIIPRTDCFLKKEKEYLLSFWFYNKDELRNQVNVILEECDKQGRNYRWDIIANPMNSMKIMGDWSLVETRFRLRPETETIHLFVKGDDRSSQEFYLDELIIRPADVKLYYRSGPDTSSYNTDMISGVFMNATLQEVKTVDQDKINEIMAAIRNSPEWLEAVKKKAIQQNIPIDSMIYRDAVYTFEENLKKAGH